MQPARLSARYRTNDLAHHGLDRGLFPGRRIALFIDVFMCCGFVGSLCHLSLLAPCDEPHRSIS